MAVDLKLIDADQVIRSVFDKDLNRLRVDAVVSATIGDLEVALSHTEDSVRIGDGTNLVEVTSDGEMQVRDDDANTSLETLIDQTDDIETSLGNIDTTLSTLNTKFTDGTDIGDVTVNNGAGAAAVNIQDGGNSITVDGTVTTNQGGTWNINDITGTVSLPTGASTSANQTNGLQKTQIVDGSGNVIGSTANALDVNIKSGVTLEVNLDNANDDVLIYGNDGITNRVIKTDAAGELQVDVLSSALPAGAATEVTLAAINAKLTDGNDIGDVTINNTAGAGAVNIQDGGNSITVDAIDLDIRDINNATDNILVYGNDGAVNRVIKTDSNGELQIDVLSSALPTGASTSALQIAGNASLTSIDADIDVALSTRASEATLSTLNAKFVNENDIGDVTINNAAGASAVNIQDGGNSITVDAVDLDIRNLSDTQDSIRVAPVVGTLTDRSGTATTTSSQIAASNATRKYFFIQNNSNSTIWFNFTTAAITSQPSIRLLSGETFIMENNFISSEAINIIAVSSTRDFTAKEG